MFKHLQRFLLLSAWAILFAHSIVPHAHEVKAELQICASEHQHDSNLLEMLGHIFHFSTGVEHLEDYNAGSAAVAIYMQEAPIIVRAPFFAPLKLAYFAPKTHFSESHARYRPLRAPPVYS
jgi:hypothetical protein